MKIVSHFIKDYPITCVLFAVIWYLSLFFKAPETPLDNVLLIDKWVHLVMYGGTCGVLWIEYHRWAAPVIMSGIIEILQEYCTETRNGDWIDLTANALGVTLGAIFGLTFIYFSRHKE